MFCRWIFAAFAFLTGYISLFSLFICPHHSSSTSVVDVTIPYFGAKTVDYSAVSPFVSANCHYIGKINSENVDCLVDDFVFNYKIYVQPYFSLFNQYYYPKVKLAVSGYYDRVRLFYDYSISPRIHYHLDSFKVQGSRLLSTIGLQLVKLRLAIANSSTYKLYQSSEFHNKYVLAVYAKACVMLENLFANSNIQKINEKKSFLVNEFNNLIDLKFGTKKVDVDLKEFIQEELTSSGLESNSDDESDGPITVRLTSTIYETANSVETRSPVELKIDGILDSFESKINKTVALALSNISNEINPVINKTIEDIQPQITEIFKTIQSTNYELYKEAHQMIKQIDKDLSNLKEYGYDSYNETVSRQDMRDMISKIKEYDEKELAKVEQLLNNNFGQLVNNYLFIIQDTIDILESFMDSSFQDFQNKLSVGLSQSEDEQYNWGVWKKYHGLKNKVLDKRDFIFYEAENLKNKKYDQLSLDNDFKNWLKFVTSLDFHINYIHRDNDEYCQLIRAKANVSYQLREAAIYEIENPTSTQTKIETVVVDSAPESPVAEPDSGYESDDNSDGADKKVHLDSEEVDQDVDFSDDPEVDFD